MKRPKLKKASKRMSCHKRYKIQKKVREHNKKLRREAKKRGHKKPKKDLRIPNAAPFKEEILQEAEQRKQMREELKQKQKLDRQKELEKKRKQEANKKDANEVKDPEKKAVTKQKENSNQRVDKNSKKWLCKELKQVIETSDVVLEVLDARDPIGCRCPQVEQLVSQSNGEKKLLLVLNKIDLIPKENLEKWLKYLKNEFPTVAFKSATLLKDRIVQVNRHARRGGARIDLSRASLCFGRECLLNLLQEYSIVKEKVINVGVVGFPNVGKSSIINSLKEVRACNVGPVRGLTKCIQTVHIDKQIKMLDSPSITVAPSSSALALALRCTTSIDSGNLLDAVDAILNHCSKQQIMLCYNISDYRSSLEFLTLLAQKRGMLKKRGLPDTESAAKLFLYDWTGAKISYYSRPPASWNLSPHLSSEAVAALQCDFDLENLEKENKNTIEANRYPNQASSIPFQSSDFTDGVMEDNELPKEVLEQESMEVSEDEEELTEGEEEDAEEENDAENAEEFQESIRPASNKITSEVLKGKNVDQEKSLSGKQFNMDKTDGLDDAYDFNTDYV